MSSIDLPTLKTTVRTVVRRADARGDIDAGEFTLKIAKQEIGKALGVEPEVLNSKEWKQVVKDLVFEAIELVEKSSPVKPAAKPKKPEEAMQVLRGMLSDEERERKGEGKKEGKAVRKDKVVKKDVKKKEQSRKGSSSDDSSNLHVLISRAKTAISSSESEAPTAPRRKRAKIDPDEDASDVESTSGGYKDSKRDGNGAGTGKKGKRDPVSESESEVDSPKRSKAANGKGKKETNGKKAKPTKPTSSTTTSSTPVVEDERVKELKSIVVACGVRKQWKKEFQDMTTADEQLAHLKRLLTSLGMRGQPTRGKAKVIKEKREMAAELGDVLEFEAKRGLGITRRGQADASEVGQQSPPGGRGSKRAAAVRRTVVASAAYVGSSEDQPSSESESESESEDEEESDGLNGGGSDHETEDEDTGKIAREKKRKMVASSEDSDTE